MVALLLLSDRCIVTKNVRWLFLTVPWVGLQYVIFPDHTHLLFDIVCEMDHMKYQSLTMFLKTVTCIKVVWTNYCLLQMFGDTLRVKLQRILTLV